MLHPGRLLRRPYPSEMIEWRARQQSSPQSGDRGFESRFLQGRVVCELHAGGAGPDGGESDANLTSSPSKVRIHLPFKWQPAAVACGFTPRLVRDVAAGAEPEVRIHLPPADSLSLSRFCFRTLRTRLSGRVWAAGLTTGQQRRARVSIARQPAAMSLPGHIPVPQCR